MEGDEQVAAAGGWLKFEMQAGEAKALHTRVMKSGLDVDDPELAAAWEDVRNGKAMWLVCSPHATDKNKVAFVAKGDGGYDTLKEVLAHSPDDVRYCVFGFFEDGRARLAFLAFVGDGVSGMKRARVALQKQAVSNRFEGTTVDLTANGEGELAEIPDKLAAACRGSATLVAP